MSKPVWFITGCSSGFGKELCKFLLESRKYNVVVTARNLGDVVEFASSSDALVIELDVTNKEQVSNSVNIALSHFGKIDVLVNNAGYGLFGSIEESSDKEVRDLYDVNVFGVVNMIREVLPSMRNNKSGTIVNISSLAGICGCPGAGHYSATKFAIDGLTDALSQEVKPLGIKAIVVHPSQFRTNWADSSKTAECHISDYDSVAKAKADQLKANSGKQAGDPVRAAQKIVQVVESSDPPLHLLLGNASFSMATQKLETLKKEYSNWEIVSKSVEFPK
jgi:NAD(P)-dependent dehydrogenase (short-subunit alcohol dehydrogenase family)